MHGTWHHLCKNTQWLQSLQICNDTKHTQRCCWHCNIWPDWFTSYQSALLLIYYSGILAPVVQTLDSVIHGIKIYPLDSAIGFPNTYPLDSDLSGGYRYPTFEQPGPGVYEENFDVNIKIAQASQLNIWNFIVGKSSLHTGEMALNFMGCSGDITL